MAYICYIDEAGCTTPLAAARSDIQPVLVIAGLVVQGNTLASVTNDFLNLKRRFYPGLCKSQHMLDDVREEIKGADIRKLIRRRGMKAASQLRFIDEILALLEAYECRLLAVVWIKGVGKPFNSRAIYTRSIQMACNHFQEYLEVKHAQGVMIADFRTVQLNGQVAHSIFTQKYRAKGDPFGRILELPTFGVSNNHVGLQLTDILCSALLFPMASSAYCFGNVVGVHVNPRDLMLRQRYAKRLKKLQFRCTQWSVQVLDQHSHKSSAELFVVPPRPVATPAQTVLIGEKLMEALIHTEGMQMPGALPNE